MKTPSVRRMELWRQSVSTRPTINTLSIQRFAGMALVGVLLMPMSIVAQTNGLSSNAEGLSATADSIGDAATGLSRAGTGGADARLNETKTRSPGATSNANRVDSSAESEGRFTAGPCSAEYRHDRKRGKNPGSRLNCD